MKSLTYHTTNRHSMESGEDNITYVTKGTFTKILTFQSGLLDEKRGKMQFF